MENSESKFGQKLRSRRIEMGFRSQSALAKRIGTYASQVNRWEQGHAEPDIFYRSKLCDALKVKNDFFGELLGSDFEESRESQTPLKPPSRSDIIAEIVLGLASLDDVELRAIAGRVRAATASRSNKGSSSV